MTSLDATPPGLSPAAPASMTEDTPPLSHQFPKFNEEVWYQHRCGAPARAVTYEVGVLGLQSRATHLVAACFDPLKYSIYNLFFLHDKAISLLFP